MTTKDGSLARRSLLRGVGLGTAGLAYLPPFARRAAAAPPRRLVVFFTACGIPDAEWTPMGTESSFAFKRILEPVAPFQSDLLFLRGLDWLSFTAQPGLKNDHPPVLPHILTAGKTVEGTYADTASVDQVIAQRIGAGTKFASLNFGVEAGGHPTGSISYRAAKQPIPAESQPDAMFKRLFGAGVMPAPAMDRLHAERRSVLDLLSRELGAVRKRLPVDDQRKMDAHLEAVRSIERRLTSTSSGAGCAPALAPPPGSDPSFVRTGRQQLDLLITALKCDVTRVGVIQWSRAGSPVRFPWLGVEQDHHTLAHFMAGGTFAEQREKLVKISRFYAEQFAYLIGKLKEVREGDGTLLDNTVVMWTNEHGDPAMGHPRKNLPFLLAGRAGGALRPGRFLSYDDVGHGELYVSLCHALGLTDVKTFGNPEVCRGPLPGLG